MTSTASNASQLTAASASTSTGRLQLTISTHSVGSYSASPGSIINDADATQSMIAQPIPPTNANTLTLLSGPLEQFLKYSRTEQSKWLLDIAHDICDPLSKRGSLLVWKPDMEWSPVTPADPLTASTYSYQLPPGVVVGLSKISARDNRSKTSATGDAQAGTMANRAKARDGVCWVSQLVGPLINSHICPKRMGDHLARVIYDTFSPSTTPIPDLSIYDERFGISLSASMSIYFSAYQLGFRAVGVNQYQCHVFMDDSPGWVWTIYGEAEASESTTLPLLHGRNITPPHPHHPNNPPAGLLRWNYLQCVLAKFGHTDYKALPNIYYSELPFRAYGDSDDEGTDSEADWPSAVFDRARALKATLEDDAQRQSDVAHWVESAVRV
ncbi:hypothetical protein C8F01DRAFT_1118949 [Mycena amicta]|nr:hypothetical protein C8F01DRAFT_1118949 [Mycena amicta]